MATDMEKFRALVEESARQHSLMTEGFARAFIDATGLHPQEAEMVVQTTHDFEGMSMTEKIWFQRRARL